ncbi:MULTISPECIES: TIGR03016 family PEP-CTERM system-associated outer membrane protein [unclassified Massilia]|uniref:TIGR03016 family PEP-CTERM system-associated outer membrane protein n=1 Tax=unclassified Massilia TaxID=2609279 RepID=UPI00177A8DA1|nr:MULTISPECIES: TIGR03016 family PEP-CTERM system-associated outer membrane protein [unclassified Massilia]MBD8531322.1 TIGR03016 family PEP-CTERM system-associated outer membrane protein [Massilia sp. CFBP 13647]MBD8674424.1 TIGR03016 family PEP-CTERM system-associated outer membrane protein [Massilia sp. CFBP 13721]
MTITTAKRIAARLPRLVPLAAALAVALPAQAQWRVTPSLSLTETYSDNPALASDAQKRSQWISEATPGIAVYGQNARVQLNASARASLYSYSDGRPGNMLRNNIQYDASGRANVIDELLYVDARMNGGTRPVTAFGPDSSGLNRYTGENRTKLSNWSISPYLVQRFGNVASATLRYTHDSVDADDVNFGKSSSDSAAIDLVSGRAWRDIGWNLRYVRQNIDAERLGTTTSENALLGLSYRLHRTLKLTASGGYDSYDYEAMPGNRTAGTSWSGGFAWNPSARTAVQMSAGRHFLGKTGSLLATHRSRHTVWQASYSDSVTNTRQQFAGVQGVDTLALLDSLFAATIPDPLARRQAVLDYLLATGLPLSTVQSVNYLTNRYFREKNAQASFAYNMRKQSSVLTFYANERTALSTSEADAGLLGSGLFALNDNVRQVGASLAHSYRLNALTSATASATATRSRSLETNFETDQQNLRLTLTRRFSRKLSGNVELRHNRGDLGVFGAGYKENAISATLSAQL